MLTALIYIFNGYLQLKGNHIAPGLMGLPMNIILIVAIILSSVIHIYLLPLGKVVAAFVQLLFLIYFAKKQGFAYKPIVNLKNKHIKKIGYIALPITLSSSVEQLNKLIDTTLASYIAVGGISALNYANQLNLFVQGIFVASITVVFYPMISKMAAENNMLSLKKTLSQTIVVISVLLVPATVGMMVFAEPLVKLLFGRGAFKNQAIEMTSTALFFYSIGMVGYGLTEVLNQVFYSLQDTKTPMVNALMAVSLNIVLSLILSRYLGVGGMALATSISAIVCTILLFISLGKKIGYFEMKSLSLIFLKIMLASMLMGIIVKYTYVALNNILHLYVLSSYINHHRCIHLRCMYVFYENKGSR